MRSECLERLTREERIRLAVLRSAGALIEAEMTEEEVPKNSRPEGLSRSL
jgi:hypothetical protein